MFVEVGNVRPVLLREGIGLGQFLHHVEEQPIDHPAQVVFHLLPLDGTVNPKDEGLVLDHRVAQGNEPLLPGVIALPPLESPAPPPDRSSR